MVTQIFLAKKNRNLNWRKKKFSLVLKIYKVCVLKTQQISIFSTTLNIFPQIQILIFLRQAIQGDNIRQLISLNNVQKFLVVLGVVDMCHLLLIVINKVIPIITHCQVKTHKSEGPLLFLSPWHEKSV